MLILRDENGNVKEVPMSLEQFHDIEQYVVPTVQCISCELQKEDHTPNAPHKKPLAHNKYVHLMIHIVLAACVLIPFFASHFHLDSGLLIGVGSLYTGMYSTFFAFKMDREGVKVK